MDADIGVFGGSGFYEFLDDASEGRAVDAVRGTERADHRGEIDGRRVAFLPRHGRRPRVRACSRPGAREHLGDAHARRAPGHRAVRGRIACHRTCTPGDFVVLDQLVDRTTGRADTYYDAGDAHHVSFADPYCPVVAKHAVGAGERAGVRMHTGGTVVVIPGPRFSTRAESRWYRAQGWHVVNMTQYPEAYLARELGIHYAGIALVTDYDTGVDDDPAVEPVTQEQVFGFFEANVQHVRGLLLELIPRLPDSPRGCRCEEAIGPLHAYES